MPPRAPRSPLKRQRATAFSDSGSAVEQENAAGDGGVAPRGSNLLLRAHGALLEENGRLRKEIDEKNERISDLEERNATLVAAQAPRTQKLHAEDIELVELRLVEVAATEQEFAARDARIAELESEIRAAPSKSQPPNFLCSDYARLEEDNAAKAQGITELEAELAARDAKIAELAPPAPAAAGHDPKDEEERSRSLIDEEREHNILLDKQLAAANDAWAACRAELKAATDAWAACRAELKAATDACPASRAELKAATDKWEASRADGWAASRAELDAAIAGWAAARAELMFRRRIDERYSCSIAEHAQSAAEEEEPRKAEFDARNPRIRAPLPRPSLSDPRGGPPPPCSATRARN